jgi:hypothetical protein
MPEQANPFDPRLMACCGSVEDALATLAQNLGGVVFYDAPAMPLESVELVKSMLGLAYVQIEMQIKTRKDAQQQKAAGEPAPSPPAPERRKRGRRPSRAAGNGTNGQHPPAPVSASPADQPLFPEQHAEAAS